jgi:hypothetical protein
MNRAVRLKSEKEIQMEQQSEVARLIAQIQAEYYAGQQALHGLASGSARHDFINKRTERMAQRMDELLAAVGEEQAMQMMIAWQDEAAK